MADAPKKRRASGPRQSRPVFAVVSYTNEQGASVQLDRSRLNIAIERDAGKLLEMVTGSNQGPVAVVQVQLPQPQKRNAADAGGAAAA
jgi:hypothetical protein